MIFTSGQQNNKFYTPNYTTDFFHNIVETINSQNLINMFSLYATFNSELIKQFYATLYVSGEANDTTTSISEWMIQVQVFSMSSQEFMELSIFPLQTGQKDKIH